MKTFSLRIPKLFSTLLALTIPAHASSPPKRSKNVAKDAHWCNGSWFAVVEGGISWKDAKKKCEAAGGLLAVVPDEVTWNALKTIIPPSDYWLGATDEETQGKWKWVDGTSLTYAPWRAGEPNNVGNNEHYLVSSWGDVPENYGWTKGYVCQWKTFDSIMAYRADVEDQNSEVAAVLKHFREDMQPAIQAHHTAILAADGAYAAALMKEIEAATKRNAAEVVVALQNELALIKKETPIPDDLETTPAVLVRLRKAHREQCWKADDERNRKAPPVVRRYDPFLDKLQARILRDGAVNQAMEVKLVRDSMQTLLQQ